jgi:hypothetical protein
MWREFFTNIRGGPRTDPCSKLSVFYKPTHIQCRVVNIRVGPILTGMVEVLTLFHRHQLIVDQAAVVRGHVFHVS